MSLKSSYSLQDNCRRGIYVALLVACMLLLVTSAAAAGPSGGSRAALNQFQAENPGVMAIQTGSRVTRLYGRAFGGGGNPAEAADRFCREQAALFGVDETQLVPTASRGDGRSEQGLMYNRQTGQYKFTLVYRSQELDGIPVFGSELRLLVRNEPGYPVVQATSSLRPLGEYRPDKSIAGARSVVAEQAALADQPTLTKFSEQKTVIFAGTDDRAVEPRTAVVFEGSSDFPERFRYVVDPLTGEILAKEDLIIFETAYGNVSGMATEGSAADFCEDEVLEVMPYARVTAGELTTYTDADGDFTLPYNPNEMVQVESRVWGQWFRVYNAAGDDAVLSATLTSPELNNFIHSAPNTDAFYRAQVNAYIEANAVRDLVLSYNPSYPSLDQQEFHVNVNLTGGFCPGNAWYDPGPVTINFCQAGGIYPNTAWSDVIYHEYGHHLVQMAGSGQGQYGEGMGDCVAMLISDSPDFSLGFEGDCNEPLRDGDNTIQYPCDDEIHICGQLLSGCVWDVRNALATTYPATFREILSDLTINSILLHLGNKIDPEITIDFLILDDDDADLSNGTPHSTEILAGFSAHNMDFGGSRIYVDGVNGDDVTGDGTDQYPYATIQKGIDEAIWADSVLVLTGTYNESIDFSGMGIVVKAVEGPLKTTIVGDATTNLVNFLSGESPSATIDGFRLQGGARGVNAVSSAPTIRRCVIVGAAGDGVKINSDGIFEPGGAIIENNTIVYCGGSGIANTTIQPNVIRNNIVAFNGTGIFRDDYGTNWMYSAHPDLHYNDVYGNTDDYYEAYPDAGSISLDPVLATDSARIGPTSPCIDAGDPDPLYNDPDGTRADIGAILYFVDTILVPDEFTTIQGAIDYARDSDVVLVGPGTYNENWIRYNGKAITVTSTEGPTRSIINGGYGGTIVQFNHDEDTNSVFDGFKLVGGTVGVQCNDAGPTITHCMFSETRSYVTDAGAICLFGDTWGSTGHCPAKIINNTLANSWGNGITDKSVHPPIIKNNIIYNNDGIGIDFSPSLIKPFYHPELSYNDVYANDINYHNITDTGTGSMMVDPLIFSGLTLRFNSPCIDAGDPDPIYNDPDNSRNDMGAKPYTEPILIEPPPRPKLVETNPDGFALSQNFPNPFNPTTTIAFNLPSAGQVKLRVINILGQTVKMLVDRKMEAGPHQVVWDAGADKAASGIYFYRLEADGLAQTRRMLLLK